MSEPIWNKFLTDRDKAVFLPKSAIEYDRKGAGTLVTVTLPEALAIDKGLV